MLKLSSETSPCYTAIAPLPLVAVLHVVVGAGSPPTPVIDAPPPPPPHLCADMLQLPPPATSPWLLLFRLKLTRPFLLCRFAPHPLVMGPPHVRFHAAAPLISSMGYRLGSL